jgi:hypothetical protein
LAHGIVPGLALKTNNNMAALFQPAWPAKERKHKMQMFKILDIAGTILAWVIVFAVIWATIPLIVRLLILAQSIHKFAK